MELLTAVNVILPALGEAQVTSLDIRHPTVAMIQQTLDLRLRSILASGWWFNSYETTFTPDISGKISVPSSVLTFRERYNHQYAIVNGNLRNMEDGGTYQFSNPVSGFVTEYVPFEAVPEVMASYVLYDALTEDYLTDIGLEDTLTAWQLRRDEAKAAVFQEHTRQRKYSTQKTKQWQRFEAVRRRLS